MGGSLVVHRWTEVSKTAHGIRASVVSGKFWCRRVDVRSGDQRLGWISKPAVIASCGPAKLARTSPARPFVPATPSVIHESSSPTWRYPAPARWSATWLAITGPATRPECVAPATPADGMPSSHATPSLAPTPTLPELQATIG